MSISIAASESGVSRRQLVLAIGASSLGWSLDLFDLFILLYVAPIIGELFFPSSYPMLSLAAVYASFAVTLLMRPIGSALFGNYADRYGRRGPMIVAVIGVGLSTAMFGALPTIHQVGLAAPVAFLALRLVQGVFVGGVVASTHTIGTETVPESWRGFISGFIGAGGAGFGALLASVVFLATSAVFPDEAFAVWGWRFMFFAGIISALLGLFIFNKLEESPFFKELALTRASSSKTQDAPLRMLFSRRYLPVYLLNLLITIGSGAGYYLTSGYLPTFLKIINKLPNTAASGVLVLSSVLVICTAPLVGYLSDKVGRRTMFLSIGLLAIGLVPASYLQLASETDSTMILIYCLVISFLGNASYAPLLIFLNERFPTSLRATGTAMSWNVGFAIGGMMPAVVSLLSGSLGNLPVALSVFLAVAFLVYLIGAMLVPETRGKFL
jgi:MFS transporter, MHS family, proline/betaine transporter